MFGLEGVELALIIVFATLLAGIMSGYPVAFALGGSAILSYILVSGLSQSGVLLDGSGEPLIQSVQRMFERNPGLVPNRIFGNILGGPSVDVLLAVPLFVFMGIALERSRVAEDLLTTMAKLFGSLPGGLAISVVIVGALLAASTGIVGATVVTMGLLALPTMLKRGYSPELACGTICASGTLGQIIPPSIVLVLLGQQVGEIYSEYHPGEVVSVGTLFKGAILPGLLLVSLYITYILIVAFIWPDKAPAIHEKGRRNEHLEAHGGSWSRYMSFLLGGPLFMAGLWIVFTMYGLSGTQQAIPGQEASFVAAPISTGSMALFTFAGICAFLAYALFPAEKKPPLIFIVTGAVSFLYMAAFHVDPSTALDKMVFLQAIPIVLIITGLRDIVPLLAKNEIIRVVFPPVVLILAVLGSILGGVTNPTAAAGLGAGGAIMLAALRLSGKDFDTRWIIRAGIALIALVILVSIFDLRIQITQKPWIEWAAVFAAIIAFHIAVGGMLWASWILYKRGTMSEIVRTTTMITSMVFFILIGSQLLNLTLKSFGGDEYIQDFLLSFGDGDRKTVLIVVLIVIFLMGFVLDFLEIIYIVIPIVGPVLFSGDLDPVWVTILIAVNLQTSFLTPPFGFALFYLRGVAPKSVRTIQIYKGVLPFVLIQILAMVILWNFESISTFLPELLPPG
ncbi:MAG: TRAP transporter large permease subunit [Cohaesibacteraceae bacterium]|nr:TRAP transporter large permease subunit [Cohaesibacteraceae bacterium]